tara:strand:- start:54 stop:884 length:831 start_codon:yes stop_codon:yes gene_type:complete
MTTLSYYQSKNSKFIKISGNDSNAFIQGLITNDINKCSEDILIYSSLLSPQGKFLADFFIFKKNDSYIFEINEKYHENFMKKLNLYKLKSNIKIDEISSLNSFVIFNEIELKNNFEIYNKDPRSTSLGKKLIQNKSLDFNEINLNEINEIKYHEMHIKNNVPYSPYDLFQNKSLLLENNFDNINAISWEKGCYVGQEITARMKYRSLLKKKLYPLEIISGKISLNDKVIENNLNFGEVISKANNYIFCILKIELAEEKIKENSTIKINDQTLLKFL